MNKETADTMHLFRFVIIVGFQLILVHSLPAQDCTTINQSNANLTSHLSLLEDPIPALTIKEPYNIPNSAFKTFNTFKTFKNAHGYWAKLNLCNEDDYTNWSLQVSKNKLSHFKVIYPSLNGSKWIIKNSGEFEPHGSQDGYFPIQSNHNHVDIKLASNEETTLYLYFRNDRKFSKPNIAVSILPQNGQFYESLTSWKTTTYLATGFFLFLIALGTTFFYSTQDKAFLYYALYLTSLLIWIFYSAGLFDNWLSGNFFPDHPENSHLIGTVVICYYFYISFLWHFGKIFKTKKWGRRYFKLWAIYIIAFIPVIIATNLYTKMNIQIFFSLGLLFNFGMILFTTEAIRRLWNSRKATEIRYVIIGLFIMMTLLLLASLEIISNGLELPEFSVISILFIVEILFFLWALSQRYQTFLKYQTENAVIAQNLKEKDTLLREIHHRVKNNLQVISALLTLQSKHVKDEIALEALQEGQGRVQSMALIHQDLYQHDNLKGVNTKDYFEKLIENLIHTYQTEDRNIELQCDIQPMMLDVDTMIPLGLVVNELTSNALKHAFKNRNSGHITITLKEVNEHLKLKVQDDGLGTEPLQLENKSFGFSLIKSFARRLEAELLIESKKGLSVELIIKNYKKAA